MSRLALGLAAAACALAALTGCGGSSTGARAGHGKQAISIEENQRVLSAAESRHLLAWVGRLRACLAAGGVRVGTLHTTRKQITLPVDASLSVRVLLRKGVACGDALGGPPKNASLQTFRGRLIMYLPKACLLDAKVAAGAPR